jgi:Na+-transporting NADH:ubiquinone oxidoreductase subunit NqrF
MTKRAIESNDYAEHTSVSLWYGNKNQSEKKLEKDFAQFLKQFKNVRVVKYQYNG